ncbi:exosortase C-terminal domain/associated protein EpsI [uncultured Pseudodesulfovibrio sp.]|uniref:exosortase C-terminal domain/associated protein EpsI n=1 Tax=uncultured Pseudodesulfovibrio sp. TaxID=2035858 RepID=UPI0029C8FE08|nr:exosortase C-terminal domain/associated protein EpsI [uncultured Pseudodesulfovibrio sp.]
MNRKFVLVLILLLAAGAYIHLVEARPMLLEKPLAEFPVRVGEWRMVQEDIFSSEIMAILRPTDYMSRDYVDREGHRVTLYIGYHGGRKGDGGIHSPRNCLPSAGWYTNSTGLVEIPLSDGQDIKIADIVMSKNVHTVSFYYWYQVRGEILTNEYALKLSEIWNTLVSRRKDAAFIRVSMPLEEGQKGPSETLNSFVRTFYPVIAGWLPSK